MSNNSPILTTSVPLTEENVKNKILANKQGIYVLTEKKSEKIVYIGSSEAQKQSGVRERLLSYLSNHPHNEEVRKLAKEDKLKFWVHFSQHPRATEGLLILLHDTVNNGLNKRNELREIATNIEQESKLAKRQRAYSHFIGAIVSQLSNNKLTYLEKRGYKDLVQAVKNSYWFDIKPKQT